MKDQIFSFHFCIESLWSFGLSTVRCMRERIKCHLYQNKMICLNKYLINNTEYAANLNWRIDCTSKRIQLCIYLRCFAAYCSRIHKGIGKHEESQAIIRLTNNAKKANIFVGKYTLSPLL